jgi:predicted metal-binding membrane protein
MMAAMLLPSSAPLVQLYRGGSTPARTALLAVGFLAVWAAV